MNEHAWVFCFRARGVGCGLVSWYRGFVTVTASRVRQGKASLLVSDLKKKEEEEKKTKSVQPPKNPKNPKTPQKRE
jgi:hypothetical protein